MTSYSTFLKLTRSDLREIFHDKVGAQVLLQEAIAAEQQRQIGVSPPALPGLPQASPARSDLVRSASGGV